LCELLLEQRLNRRFSFNSSSFITFLDASAWRKKAAAFKVLERICGGSAGSILPLPYPEGGHRSQALGKSLPFRLLAPGAYPNKFMEK
jgi:hypothetical protein